MAIRLEKSLSSCGLQCCSSAMFDRPYCYEDGANRSKSFFECRSELGVNRRKVISWEATVFVEVRCASLWLSYSAAQSCCGVYEQHCRTIICVRSIGTCTGFCAVVLEMESHFTQGLSRRGFGAAAENCGAMHFHSLYAVSFI